MDYTKETIRMLENYCSCGQEIQKLNAELNQTLQMKIQTQNTLKAQCLTGMPHTYGVSDTTYNAVERSIDKHETHIVYLTEQIELEYDIRETINEAVKKLTMEEFRVIDLHYFKHYKIGRLSGIMHYQKTRCYELKESAIKKIALYIKTAEENGKKRKKPML